jgi:protein TonB
MSNPKETHEPIRQNGRIVKKPQKHDANLQKSTTIYFQIGLILCLLLVYSLFEMKFETKLNDTCEFKPINEPDLFVNVPSIKTVQPEKKELEKRQKVKIVDPKFVIKEEPEFITKEPVLKEPPINPDAMPEVYKIPEEVDMPIAFVETVPIYPGCEKAKNNDERRKCMSEKISKLVQKNFDGSIAPEYGLSGVQRINVVFKIDKTGHVTNIRARSTHPKLDEEAERVINRIPDMVPGRQLDKPVGVIYSLPIIFKVQD